MKRLAILIIAALVVWGAVALWPAGQEPEDRTESVWPALSLDTIRDISIEGQGRGFGLACGDDGSWRVVLPGVPARPKGDEGKVRALVEFISTHQPKRVLGPFDPGKAANFGLDNPVVIKVAGAANATLTIGGANPSGDGVYGLVSMAPGQLLLLDPEFATHADRGPAHYYDLRVLDVVEDEVETMTLFMNGTQAWKLLRDKDGFMFASGSDGVNPESASQDEARFYLHNLAGMKAGSLLLKSVADQSDEVLKVVLEQGGTAHELAVARQGDRYVANSTFQPVAFELDPDQVARLDKNRFDMRRRTIVDFDTGKVHQFTLVQGDQALAARKNEKGWKEKITEKDIPGIDMSLWRLTNLRFEAEPETGLPDTARPAVSWRLKDDNGKQLKILTFYSDAELPAGLCWLREDNGTFYYPVPDQILKDLQGQIPSRD